MTYYLASKGRLKLLPNTDKALRIQSGVAIAAVTNRNRRVMTAEVLGHYESLTAHLWCEYQVLSHEVFARVFSGYYTGSIPQPDKSPYSTSIPFDVLSASTDSIVARTSEVEPENFSGHFDNYPSWPVAILADTFGQVRTALLHNIVDRQTNYRVGYLNVDAFQLAPALARLTFEVTCIASFPSLGRYVFGAKVLWGDKTIAAMESEVYASGETLPTTPNF
jgi:3-hydroxymyristoyl/3-hydroxydecanoyl-(acyl carrier protein) dehydratase